MKPSKRPVFINPALEKQFQRKGYVVVDLLNTEQTHYLRQQLAQLAHHQDAGFYTTTWLKQADIRLQTNQILTGYLKRFLDKILLQYKFFYGNYFIKNAGEQSDCMAHQDWTTTDETKYTSVTVWCALQDMTPANGCLRVMPGSHRLTNYIRARHVPEYVGKVSRFMHTYLMQNLPMREGQAVIFNQRLVHGSGSNLTGQRRIACGVAAVPQEAPLLHYVAGPQNTLRLLDASNNLFSRYDTFDTLQNEPAIATIPATGKQLQWYELSLLTIKRYLF